MTVAVWVECGTSHNYHKLENPLCDQSIILHPTCIVRCYIGPTVYLAMCLTLSQLLNLKGVLPSALPNIVKGLLLAGLFRLPVISHLSVC